MIDLNHVLELCESMPYFSYIQGNKAIFIGDELMVFCISPNDHAAWVLFKNFSLGGNYPHHLKNSA